MDTRGVPAGDETGQILAKSNNSNYNTVRADTTSSLDADQNKHISSL